MNKITLIGRLTKDPELKSTQSGKKLATFTLAVPKSYKKDAERTADFIPCIAWEGLAETIDKYVKKGHRVAIEGRLETSKYEKDDRKYTNYFVTVTEFDFLEPKAKEEDPEEQVDPSELGIDPADIPF